MQLLINRKILEYFKADLSFFKARVYAISCKKKKNTKMLKIKQKSESTAT